MRIETIRNRLSTIVLLATVFAASVRAELKPNIVLIMCDDLGFSDIGCYGGEVMTPNLDRLAAEGMRFTQFYNNAKCTTTRASILTGLYPRFGEPHLRQNMVTLGEALGLAGYRTALCGKWHLGRSETTHPYKRGFQSFYGLLDGCCNFFNPSQRDPDYKGGRIREFGINDQPISEFPDDFYTTDAFTDHAVRAIRESHQVGRPFFVHVTYTAPHYPLHAKPEDIAKYRGKFKMGWEQLRKDRWRRMQALGLTTEAWSFSQDDERSYPWDGSDHDFEDHRMAVYAAMIDCMDQNIGRILDTLRETGHDKDTLVMFLSDNGGCAEEPGGRDPTVRTPGPANDYVAVGPAWGWAQNAPFRRYKSWLHEGGISTPFIAWWPDQISPGSINRSAAHIIDLMPTFLELAGSEYPQTFEGHAILPVEGKSIVPLLHGESREGHTQLAWYWSKNRALRQGDWKLVWDKLSSDHRWELYNLADDRCETIDLAKTYPDRVESMAQAWFEWADMVGLEVKP